MTATATPRTTKHICSSLHLQNPVVVKTLPNKLNITYFTTKVKNNIAEIFKPLAENLRSEKQNLDRVLFYCHSVRTCSQIYKFFHSTLGPDSYYPTEAPPTPENRLFGMFHHCSTNQIKEVILNSLSNPNGVCRIVFATVALGMGFSSQNIHHVIHYGIVEIYLKIYCQERGRAGRDGEQATAILLFCGCDLHP